MKIVCISDTHSMHRNVEVPSGDLLIHAGDFMSDGRNLRQLSDFVAWFQSLPHKHKILIAGNNDAIMEETPEVAEFLFEGFTYLNRSSVDVEGFRFYGTPYTPAFMDWSFNSSPEQAERFAREIPGKIDVLISHGPPHEMRDSCPGGKVGCPFLAQRIRQTKPRYLVCGHIHEGYGMMDTDFGTTIINAAILDGNYKVVNKPLVFNL